MAQMGKKHRLVLVALFALLVSGCTVPSPNETLPVLTTGKATEEPAMCPWREPDADLHRFFPKATHYKRDTLILSSLRVEVLRRLGPKVPIQSNTLYAYRAQTQTPNEENATVGTLLVRRVSGQWGAIEMVLAVNNARRVVGLRIQRHREPPEVAAILTGAKWLGAFRDKTANDAFVVGQDLPPVPEAAQVSAQAIAGAVRALLIEYDVAETTREKSAGR